MQDNEPMLAAMRKLGTWRFICLFFSVLCLSMDKCASHTNENCWRHNFNGDSGSLRDQHNKSQSYHGLLKLHLVSKLNLRKKKTKSLSGWKLKSCRSSENLTIRPETLTKALQIITHMVCFTTFSQRKIWWFETKLLLLLSQFLYN